MKKKFFTLLAAAAFLLGTAVPAFSAVPNSGAPYGVIGGNASGLVKGSNDGLYHIARIKDQRIFSVDILPFIG